eukprot:COSAG06_NODE_2243_length_7267_cov_3.942662_4_plen_210_part_00
MFHKTDGKQVSGVGDTEGFGFALSHLYFVKNNKLSFTKPHPLTGTNCDFITHIPNSIGYPERQRCLIQVQQVAFSGLLDFNTASEYDSTSCHTPALIGVEVGGLNPLKSYSTHLSDQMRHTDIIHYGVPEKRGTTWVLDSKKSIVEDGVLVNSPFGSNIKVRLVNMASHDTLDTFASATTDRHKLASSNSVHVTFKLLFLDEDELRETH